MATTQRGSGEKRAVSRREFGRGTVMVLAGTALGSAGVPGSRAAVRRDPQGQAPGGLGAAAAAEVEAKMQNVLRRWGDRLNEDQQTRMRGIITRHVRMLETVRAVPTDNADAPASVLKLVEKRSIPSPAKPAAAPKKSPIPSPEEFS